MVLDCWFRVCLSLDAGSVLGRSPRGRVATNVCGQNGSGDLSGPVSVRIGLVFTRWVQGEVEAVILKHGG